MITDPNQTLLEEGEKFVSIPEWILLHQQLSPQAVRLYGVLKMYARKTERAWPGRATLGEHLGCSEDSIDRHVKQLKDAGAIDVIPRWREVDPHTGEDVIYLDNAPGRSRTSNIYRLRWTEPKPQETTSPSRAVAARGSRGSAATVAAPMRQEAHAVEAHPERSTKEELARTIPPAKTAPKEDEPTTPYALADRLLVRLGGNISVTRSALVSLLEPAMKNGVPVKRLERAIHMLLREGKALAPWTLQEYVAKAAASSSTSPWA